MAKYLTWEEVIHLPPNQEVWIQYANRELVRDCIDYNEEEDDLAQEYEMSVWTKASQSYRKSWVIWDDFPTPEQFMEEEWRIS